MQAYKTQRLILRPFREDDLEASFAYCSNQENVKYLLKSTQSIEQCAKFINCAIEKANEIPCMEYNFAVELRSTHQMIGTVTLSINDTDQGVMQWVIHRDHWNNGYGTELAEFLIDFAFNHLHLRRVTAACDAENTPSWHIMEKLGMRREATFINGRTAYSRDPNRHNNEYIYAILAAEYYTKTQLSPAQAYLICGRICAGKTFYAKQLASAKNAVILSCDEIENDLFQKNLGSAHDEMAERIHSYLLKKAAEIIHRGTNVILDWGFWRKADREITSNYFKSLNVHFEWHYMDTSNEQCTKNIIVRNKAVQNGETPDYYVDEGLLKKCDTLFEPPSREEIDVWNETK